MYTFQLQWYALDKYAWTLLGRTHIEKDDVMTMGEVGKYEHQKGLNHQHITPQEL